MIYIWFLFFVTSIYSINGQAFYDSSACRNYDDTPGSRYTCTNTTLTKISCQSFLIFRSNPRFPTISAISTLFGLPPDTLLQLNQIGSPLESLFVGREIIIPASCSCSSNFFQTRFNYTITENATLADTACRILEGLVKPIALLEANPNQKDVKVGFVLDVPLKCACPNGDYKYLVTYPLVTGDSINSVSSKFGISKYDILTVNNLQSDTTIYPETTILVPLRSKVINLSVANIQPPEPPMFLPTKPVEGDVKSTRLKKVYIAVSIIGFALVIAILVVTCLYVNALNKCKRAIFIIPSTRRSSFTSFSTPPASSPRSRPSPATRSSPTCLSPDLLASIKYSLYNFTIEEIKSITKDFSDVFKVSEDTYRGSFDDARVLIKAFEFSEIRHVIDLHSKVNHVNILKLLGVCYESSGSYIVLEHPTNGSLLDCLVNSSSLTWQRRTQIAFDIAMGLHYLHYCIVPPYMQTGLFSGNIFVTSKWRAKLAVLSRNMNPGIMMSSVMIPGLEYVKFDALKTLEKENICEFGMVLLELLSGKVKTDKTSLRESIGFLGGEGGEGGCFENLKSFMDPCLKEDYRLAEALCLGVLAKACVENDPLHRPSMEDILKVLARMV